MKITVVGVGYVGLSMATLLAQNNKVIALDIVKEKVELINNKISPIKDKEIEFYLKNKRLNLYATGEEEIAYKDADFVIIATPTNYDTNKNYFDTSSVEKVIEKVMKVNCKCTIVIKSTIPVGYVNSIRNKYKINNIFFSPEFLREGKALHDNLYPSRIVIGDKSENAKIFANLLKDGAIKKDVPILYTGTSEAEAIKLFANTFLAMRVSFFNELDTYAELRNLNTRDIIEGVCLDSRIGSFYNNPSFGYGGYCLPKDTKQLLANYSDIPNNLIKAIVESNDTRKNHITNMIMKKNPAVIGIYKISMKTDSDNYRQSSIFGIMDNLMKYKDIKIVIYEPSILEVDFNGYEVISELDKFINISDIIIANRNNQELECVKHKVYTRDVFTRD